MDKVLGLFVIVCVIVAWFNAHWSVAGAITCFWLRNVIVNIQVMKIANELKKLLK